MKTIILTILTFLFLSCEKKDQSTIELPGIIFSTQQTEKVGKWLTDSAWVPSKDQIVELEEKLPEYIRSLKMNTSNEIVTRLPQYRRQYLGIVEKGQKLIYVNLFCKDYFQDKGAWKNGFVFVNDGGSCFIQVYYNPETKMFIRITGNSVG